MSTFRDDQKTPHVAIVTAAGVGHLTPLLRLASKVLSRNCKVTLLTANAFVSSSETKLISDFCEAHPEVKRLEFEPVPVASVVTDPFFLQYDAIGRSGNNIRPLLSSLSPRASAIFCDIIATSGVADIASDLGIPYYPVFTSSARFLSFSVHLPALVSNHTADELKNATEVEIPGLKTVSMLSIPAPLLNPNHLLGGSLIRSVEALPGAKGIFINTFNRFEPETLFALKNGIVSSNLPPVLAIGPLESYELAKDQSDYIQWLDKQPPEAVVYVNFGSRTATSIEQITELKMGLEMSGRRFLWVIKATIVDKDDQEDLKTLLGESFLERTKDKGMVVKALVDQQQILAHPAIAGFMSHCGWNSVVESAHHGVPVLAWPQIGDQMMNAEVVEKSGLGLSLRTQTPGLDGVVMAEEIAKMIAELMGNPALRLKAKKIGEDAKKAIQFGGSSEENIMAVLSSLST